MLLAIRAIPLAPFLLYTGALRHTPCSHSVGWLAGGSDGVKGWYHGIGPAGTCTLSTASGSGSGLGPHLESRVGPPDRGGQLMDPPWDYERIHQFGGG